MHAWRCIALASLTAVGACAVEAGSTGNPQPFTAEDDLANPERKPHPEGDCEGPEGLACPTGKYCAAAQANQCPGVLISGACLHTPEACVEMYQPACGCDGQTYGNECEAAMVGVAIAYSGQCAPACGGFAGLPCPGAGSCVDNPTDGCDPANGGSDCASMCTCSVEGLCYEGTHWDSSPEVCACVPNDG